MMWILRKRNNPGIYRVTDLSRGCGGAIPLTYRTDEPMLDTRRNRPKWRSTDIQKSKCERQVLSMSYESFKAKVNALIRRSGQRVSVRFSTDEEKGKHYANCSDGTTIIGCPCSLKVTVKWGSGHTSIATI